MEVLLREFIVQPQAIILAESSLEKIDQYWKKLGEKNDIFYKTLVNNAYVELCNKKRLSVG